MNGSALRRPTCLKANSISKWLSGNKPLDAVSFGNTFNQAHCKHPHGKI